MAYSDTDLPFAANSHESWVAAVKAGETRASKTKAYLRFLATHGPAIDHEAASALRVPLSTINSVRNGAMRCGLVERGFTTRLSPYGVQARVWVLSTAGQRAVEAWTTEQA